MIWNLISSHTRCGRCFIVLTVCLDFVGVVLPYEIYKSNADFALHVKITVLSFVPVDDFNSHVDSLANHLLEDFVPFINWFEDNYIVKYVSKNNRWRR